MIKEYAVEITEIFKKTVYVDAKNESEAKKLLGHCGMKVNIL